MEGIVIMLSITSLDDMSMISTSERCPLQFQMLLVLMRRRYHNSIFVHLGTRRERNYSRWHP